MLDPANISANAVGRISLGKIWNGSAPYESATITTTGTRPYKIHGMAGVFYRDIVIKP